MEKIDGLGQKLDIGAIVVRCGFNQYAGVQLYKIVKDAPKKVTIAVLTKDIKEKNIKYAKDYTGHEIRCAVDPSTLVRVDKNLNHEGYTGEVYAS